MFFLHVNFFPTLFTFDFRRGESAKVYFYFIYLYCRSSESQWRILNDSRVTEGLGWDQFVTRPGQDTPYLLLYHRLGQDIVDRMPARNKLAMVIADNRMYDREVEEEMRRAEEEQRRVEEENRRVEEEQRRVEEEQRRDKEEMAGQNNPLKRFFEEFVFDLEMNEPEPKIRKCM